jgi:hypothetical protein
VRPGERFTHGSSLKRSPILSLVVDDSVAKKLPSWLCMHRGEKKDRAMRDF